MTKPKPDFGGMIDLPDDPGEAGQPKSHTSVQADDRMKERSDGRTAIHSYDGTIVRKAADQKRTPRARAEPKPEPADYVQRSLYAREETFERIREFAFKSRRPAQELYREGLFLLLKKYGLAEGITKPEDI